MISPIASPKIIWQLQVNEKKRNLHLNQSHPDEKLASILFVLVGIGYLFPFSALTQPVDYWNQLFPDFNIEFSITCVYMYTNLTMLALLVFCSSTNSFTFRIVGGFFGQFIVLAFVPTSYFFGFKESINLILILSSVAFAAIVTAFLDSSVIALASQYPLRVQEYFQLGVGVSTLIGSLYRDFTKVCFPPGSIVGSSLLYFYSGAATILICIGGYFWLLSLNISKICLADSLFKQNYLLDEERYLLETDLVNIINDDSEQHNIHTPVVDKFKVLRKIFFNELLICLLFFSTLALWPPLITEIKSFNFPSLDESQWWSLILLTFFSIFDCIGRFLVRFRGCLTKDNIWIPVLLRFLFFPLIIASVKGFLFTNDFFSILFVSCLGCSNGYIGTLTIIMINDCVSTEEQSTAGTFTSFFLNVGLVLGASAGLLIDKLL